MARKREVVPPTTPLLCDHIILQNKHYCYYPFFWTTLYIPWRERSYYTYSRFVCDI